MKSTSSENAERLPVKRTWIAFIMAFIEAVCVFSVAAAKAGIVLGSGAAMVTGWSLSLHRDSIRIPVLLVAIVGSSLNIYLVLKRQRLRNSPAAAWRKKPYTRLERWKTGMVLGLSLLTLAVGAAEIYLHRLFHGTIM